VSHLSLRKECPAYVCSIINGIDAVIVNLHSYQGLQKGYGRVDRTRHYIVDPAKSHDPII
jgi:hypothetical protein